MSQVEIVGDDENGQPDGIGIDVEAQPPPGQALIIDDDDEKPAETFQPMEGVDGVTGEVTGTTTQKAPGSIVLMGELQKDSKERKSNGLSYDLRFEVAPGQGDAAALLFLNSSPRLWWHPEGQEHATLISKGALMQKYVITTNYAEDNSEQHSVIYLRLTAADIAMGIAVLVGPWTTGVPAPNAGVLTIEPMQTKMDL